MLRAHHPLERIPRLQPRLKAARQRTHAGNPLVLKFERRTGARGFVGSSAVQHHVPIARDIRKAGFDIFKRQRNRPRQFHWLIFSLQRIAEIDNN